MQIGKRKRIKDKIGVALKIGRTDAKSTEIRDHPRKMQAVISLSSVDYKSDFSMEVD